eukprot:724775-Amphidinium_carterae.2
MFASCVPVPYSISHKELADVALVYCICSTQAPRSLLLYLVRTHLQHSPLHRPACASQAFEPQHWLKVRTVANSSISWQWWQVCKQNVLSGSTW